jgi:hypothetical protein
MYIIILWRVRVTVVAMERHAQMSSLCINMNNKRQRKLFFNIWMV